MTNGKIRFGKQSGGELALVIPDGVANTEVIVPESGVLVSVDGNVTDNAVARFDGTTGKLQGSSVTIDDTGNLLLTSGTGALGYGTGAGGIVTQLTSKSTGVNINKPTGTIYTHNESLAAGASVSIPVGNTLLNGYGSGDTLVINGAFTATTINPEGTYRIEASMVGSGGARIRITNLTGASRSEVIAINFSILKGARV